MLRTRLWMGSLLIGVAVLLLLEERWFAPLLEALRSGRSAMLTTCVPDAAAFPMQAAARSSAGTRLKRSERAGIE